MNLDIDALSEMLEKGVEDDALNSMLEKVMDGHTSIQQATGITDQQLEVLYSIAYNQYAVDKYDMASKVFSVLSLINPHTHKYWMGLAASLQMSENYEKAAEIYAMATATLDKDDPSPSFNAGECYIALGNTEDALAAFRMANRYSKSNSDYKVIESKSAQIIKTLEEMTLNDTSKEAAMR